MTLAGIVAAALMAAATSRAPTRLKASIRIDGSRLVVENRDTFNWHDVVLLPGPCVQPIRSPFVRAGAAWVIDLSELRTIRGKRLDAVTGRMDSIDLFVRRPRGQFSLRMPGSAATTAGRQPKDCP